MCFYLNDTTTTEIYTYKHPLSQHYALPICHRRRNPATPPAVIAGCDPAIHAAPRGIMPGQAWMPASSAGMTALFGEPTRAALPSRSDEHTSELQSLMRISYAVFCFKKPTILS